MNVYLILAYPNREGLCYASFEKIIQGLNDAGHTVRISNLYAENFNPNLYFDSSSPRRAIKDHHETQIYRDNILWANHLIFIFPIWWSGMPAILKGFIDRVLATGFAIESNGILPKGLLKGKTAWIVNTNDTLWLFTTFFQSDYGRILKRQILALCGIKTKRHFVLNATKHKTVLQRQVWLDRLYQAALRLS